MNCHKVQELSWQQWKLQAEICSWLKTKWEITQDWIYKMQKEKKSEITKNKYKCQQPKPHSEKKNPQNKKKSSSKIYIKKILSGEK